MTSSTIRNVDGLFISYYENIDQWANDHAPSRSGPTGPCAFSNGRAESQKNVRDSRMNQQTVLVDGNAYNLSRFLSLARYNSTVEYRRYDAFTPTHLTGTYYESLAKRHGYDLHHINHATRVDFERISHTIQPRFVFISTTFLAQATCIVDVVQHARANWPTAPIILGGPLLTEISNSVPLSTFKALLKGWAADAYVVSALGEAAFLNLLECADGDLKNLSLPNTWVRREGGFIMDEELPEPGISIDENYVHWNLLDQNQLYHTVHTRTSRSCAFACSFCTFVANQGPLTLSQPETLERELERLTANDTVKSVIFTDDTLNVPPARFKQLLKVIKKFDIEWYSYYRAQFADADTTKAMADSGCKAVFLGIESINDRVLKNMNKAATRKSFTRGVRELKQEGIAIHANFIIGFPGDVPQNTHDAVEWVDGEGIDFYTLGPFYCSPSTDIAQPSARKKFGLIGSQSKWKHDTMDIKMALELEDWAMNNSKHSAYVPDLAADGFWSEIILLSNQFSVREAQDMFLAYNSHANKDQSLSTLHKDPSFQKIQAILASRELPAPPGYEFFRTQTESAALCGGRSVSSSV